MSRRVLVVGTVALDDIETPFGRKDRVLGGSCTHFALSARHFAPVSMLAAVGKDFPVHYIQLFQQRNIDTSGLRSEEGKTFRWSGKYHGDMNIAETIACELNVFGTFDPQVPEPLRDVPFAMLGNCAPEMQMRVYEQLRRPELVMLDTMNHWIAKSRSDVIEVAKKVKALCINYEETLMLAGKTVLSQAVDEILGFGVEVLIVKKAAHGALLATRDIFFQLPAFPTREVVDPTGAGDSFAGGFLGFLAQHGVSPQNLKKGLVYATVMGSFACEGFGTSRLEALTRDEIEQRARKLISMTSI